MRMIKQCAAAVAALAVGACSLDLRNPNAPTEQQVTTEVQGVIALLSEESPTP